MKLRLLLFLSFSISFSLVSPAKILAQSTNPNFKVAFIGDTGAGSAFKAVLNLVKQEGAQLILHQGDYGYSSPASAWSAAVNSVVGADFPYLGSDGNHENWSDYAPFMKDRAAKMGLDQNIIPVAESNYSFVYQGLKMVFVRENGDPAFIQSALANDSHTWKVCTWHKNMNAMQVGGKGNEMSWADYENCRASGAIIITAHEHTYHRTKTLTSTQNQIVDPSCSDPKNLCVSPGRTFVVVSGLGGSSRNRIQKRCLPSSYPYGCQGEWASIYTATQGAQDGALFITFNYQGNPNKAHGIFKTVSGQIIDEFDITAGGGGSGSASPTPTGAGKPGDANSDNQVDGLDYVIWLQNYNSTAAGAGLGDFNNNSKVDGLDYIIWLNNYNK